ncbi:MAG: hypothetical protein WDZ52_04010 [Pseudohongiellaceae bacterium]
MIEEIMPVLIVAIVFAFVSFNVYLRYRSKLLASGVDQLKTSLQDENIALKAKTQELEARIQVLESIVTSKHFALREEIESLP